MISKMNFLDSLQRLIDEENELQNSTFNFKDLYKKYQEDEIEFLNYLKSLSQEELIQILDLFQKDHQYNKDHRIYTRKGVFATLGRRHRLNMDLAIRLIKSVIKFKFK